MQELSFEDMRYGSHLCAKYDIDFRIGEVLDELPDITDIEAISVFSRDTVIVYPQNIRDSARFREVMRHEVLGHFVLRRTHTFDELRNLCIMVAAANSHSPLFSRIQKAYGVSSVEMLGEEFIASVMERDEYRTHRVANLSAPWIWDRMKSLQRPAQLRMSYDERNHDVACCRCR